MYSVLGAWPGFAYLYHAEWVSFLSLGGMSLSHVPDSHAGLGSVESVWRSRPDTFYWQCSRCSRWWIMLKGLCVGYLGS